MRYLDDLPIVKTRRRKKAKSCIKKGQRNKHASPSRYAYYITEKGLLQMTNEEIDQYAYKTGFGMFRQMGASSVEITVEKLDSEQESETQKAKKPNGF